MLGLLDLALPRQHGNVPAARGRATPPPAGKAEASLPLCVGPCATDLTQDPQVLNR